MSKRKYIRYVDVYEQLEGFCKERFQSGNTFLPSERALSQQFGVSLMTMRKAVEEGLRNGIIARSGRHTNILPNRCLAKLGKILFITGNSEAIMIPAFERMWLMLRPEVENMGGNIRYLIDTRETSFDNFVTECERADLILLTVLSDHVDTERKLDYLRKLQLRKRVISLSDPYLEEFQYAVALNNIAVGQVAACALNDAGCRRVLLLGFVEGNKIFSKRMTGFREKFHGEIRNFPRPADSLLIDTVPVEIQALERAVADQFDGLFLSTDEVAPDLTTPLIKRHLVPEKFKMVTVHGSGECYRCMLPLTNVSHSTSPVVEHLLILLKQCSEEENIRCRVLITPKLHICKTLYGIGKESEKC